MSGRTCFLSFGTVSIIPIRGIVLAEESWDALGTALLENCSIASPRFDLQCGKWLDGATVEKDGGPYCFHTTIWMEGRCFTAAALNYNLIRLFSTLFSSTLSLCFAKTLRSQ